MRNFPFLLLYQELQLQLNLQYFCNWGSQTTVSYTVYIFLTYLYRKCVCVCVCVCVSTFQTWFTVVRTPIQIKLYISVTSEFHLRVFYTLLNSYAYIQDRGNLKPGWYHCTTTIQPVWNHFIMSISFLGWRVPPIIWFPEEKCITISFKYVKIPIARRFSEFITHESRQWIKALEILNSRPPEADLQERNARQE